VFSFVIIQVKPLLEQALKLPPDSLTKEVILFPILIQLIVDYQVTTDQLAWDGQNESATPEEKIAAVSAQAGAFALLLQQIEANVTAQKNYVIQPLSQDYDYDDGMKEKKKKRNERERKKDRKERVFVVSSGPRFTGLYCAHAS